MMELSIPKYSTTNIEIRTPFQEQSTLLHLDAVPPSLWGSTWHPELNCIRNAMVRSGLSCIVRTFPKTRSYWTVSDRCIRSQDMKSSAHLNDDHGSLVAKVLHCSNELHRSGFHNFIDAWETGWMQLVGPVNETAHGSSSQLKISLNICIYIEYNCHDGDQTTLTPMKIIIISAWCPPVHTDTRQFKQGKELGTGAGGETSRKRLQQFLRWHRIL